MFLARSLRNKVVEMRGFLFIIRECAQCIDMCTCYALTMHR
jgi:hypothetical protein